MDEDDVYLTAIAMVRASLTGRVNDLLFLFDECDKWGVAEALAGLAASAVETTARTLNVPTDVVLDRMVHDRLDETGSQ
jgi:hypothetical protein